MSELTLEEWELPHRSSELLTGPVHWSKKLHWKGKNRHMGARIVQVRKRISIVFACDLDEPELGNWVTCSLLDAIYLHRYPNHGWFEYLDDYLQRAAEGERVAFGRFNVWSARRCALVMEDGRGSWLRYGPRIFIPSAFKLEGLNKNMWFRSSRDTREVIQQQWQGDTDVRFAYEWSRLGYQEKRSLWFGQPHRVEEVTSLMRLVLKVASIDHPDCRSLSWSIEERSQERCTASVHNRSDESSLMEEEYLQRWHTLFCQWLKNPNREELMSHSCMNKFLGDNWSLVSVVEDAPTQHERLEAHLRLREWLEHNAPDQIEALLPL